MIRAYLIELILLLLVLWAVGFGLVKLYYLWKGETTEDRRIARQTKREADEAHEDLERFVARAKKKDLRRSSCS